MRLFLIIPLIALSFQSNAVELDYYTYGGFDVVVNAFSRLALTFSAHQYLVLFFISTVFGILIGGVSVFTKSLVGGGGSSSSSLISFLIYIMFGAAIFKGLITPKGTMHVYDPVTNQYEAVGDVPDIIVLFAGVTNKVERIITEVADSSSSYPRDIGSGGIGLELMINSISSDPLYNDSYLSKSIRRYISDCLPPAEALSSYTFNMNNMKHNTVSLKSELAQLKSPSVFTTYYDANAKSGITGSCSHIWDTYLFLALNNPALYDEHLKKICAKSGFDVSSSAIASLQLARCKTIIRETGDMMFDPTIFQDDRKLFEDIAISQAVLSSVTETPASSLKNLANQELVSEGFGSLMVSEEWLPSIKAVVFSLVLGTFPIILLFITTPMVFKALHLSLTSIAFITLWGAIDAFIHGISMDQVQAMMIGLQNSNMGLNAIMMMPDFATKAVALIGKSQSTGIIMASVLSAIFFKLSGHAMNQLSTKYQGEIEKAGDSAASETLTPTGMNQSLEKSASLTTMKNQIENNGLSGYTENLALVSSQATNEAQGFKEVSDGKMGYTSGINSGAMANATMDNINKNGVGNHAKAQSFDYTKGLASATEQNERTPNAANIAGKIEGIEAAAETAVKSELSPKEIERQAKAKVTDDLGVQKSISNDYDLSGATTTKEQIDRSARVSGFNLATFRGQANSNESPTEMEKISQYNTASEVEGHKVLTDNGITPQNKGRTEGTEQATEILSNADKQKNTSFEEQVNAKSLNDSKSINDYKAQSARANSKHGTTNPSVYSQSYQTEEETNSRVSTANERGSITAQDRLSAIFGMSHEALAISKEMANPWNNLTFSDPEQARVFTNNYGLVGTPVGKEIEDGATFQASFSSNGDLSQVRTESGLSTNIDNSNSIKSGTQFEGENTFHSLYAAVEDPNPKYITKMVELARESPSAKENLFDQGQEILDQQATHNIDKTYRDSKLNEISAFATANVGLHSPFGGASAGLNTSITGQKTNEDGQTESISGNRIAFSNYFNAKEAEAMEIVSTQDKDKGLTEEQKNDRINVLIAASLIDDFQGLVDDKKERMGLLSNGNYENEEKTDPNEGIPTLPPLRSL